MCRVAPSRRKVLVAFLLISTRPLVQTDHVVQLWSIEKKLEGENEKKKDDEEEKEEMAGGFAVSVLAAAGLAYTVSNLIDVPSSTLNVPWAMRACFSVGKGMATALHTSTTHEPSCNVLTRAARK